MAMEKNRGAFEYHLRELNEQVRAGAINASQRDELIAKLHDAYGTSESKAEPPRPKRLREEVVPAEEAAAPVVGAASEIPLDAASDAMEM